MSMHLENRIESNQNCSTNSKLSPLRSRIPLNNSKMLVRCSNGYICNIVHIPSRMLLSQHQQCSSNEFYDGSTNNIRVFEFWQARYSMSQASLANRDTSTPQFKISSCSRVVRTSASYVNSRPAGQPSQPRTVNGVFLKWRRQGKKIWKLKCWWRWVLNDSLDVRAISNKALFFDIAEEMNASSERGMAERDRYTPPWIASLLKPW